MPSITLTDIQAQSAQARRDERRAHAEAQLRRRAAERGRDWDALGEDEREAFIDDLLHEAP